MERKISIALSAELDEALTCISLAQGLSKSRVIENLLRENPTVQKEIQILREEPDTGLFAVSKKTLKKLKRKSSDLTTKISS